MIVRNGMSEFRPFDPMVPLFWNGRTDGNTIPYLSWFANWVNSGPKAFWSLSERPFWKSNYQPYLVNIIEIICNAVIAMWANVESERLQTSRTKIHNFLQNTAEKDVCTCESRLLYSIISIYSKKYRITKIQICSGEESRSDEFVRCCKSWVSFIFNANKLDTKNVSVVIKFMWFWKMYQFFRRSQELIC